MKKIIAMAIIAITLTIHANSAVLTGTTYSGNNTVCHYSDGSVSSKSGMGICSSTR